jgi:copper transport protein
MPAVAWLFACLVAFSHAPAALAHATLLRSDPSDGAVLAQAPSILTLTFNEPVSPISLKLVSEGDHTLELREVTARGEALIVALPGRLPEGTHLLSWRVISADGHPVGGALTFSLGRPSAAAPVPRTEPDPALPALLWLARLGIYVALFGGVGGAFYAAFIAQGSLGAGLDRLLRVTLEGGLIATIASVGLQGVDVLGQPLSAISLPSAWASGAAGSYGVTAALIAASLAAAHFSLSLRTGWRRPLAALSLLALGGALAASGHASAAAPQWLTRPAVFVHSLSIAFWAGALIPLAAALAARRTCDLSRFSRATPLPFAALIVSGVVLAVVQLEQIASLWSTAYGGVLCAKLAAVAVLLALAASNRRLTRPARAGDGRAIRRIAVVTRIEVVLIALVLALVASWRFTPPPRALLLAAGQPVRVHIHTVRAMADLQIESTRADGRRITVNLLDGEFRPLIAKAVTVIFSKPDAGIEALRLPATRVADTVWQIDRLRLPRSGRWNIRVEILVSDFEKISVEDEVSLTE